MTHYCKIIVVVVGELIAFLFCVYICAHLPLELSIILESNSEVALCSMKQAQPLLALSSKHTRSHYQWECLERIDTKFHSSPVIYVNTPGLFRCTVGNSEQTVQSNVFDVQMIVNWGKHILSS